MKLLRSVCGLVVGLLAPYTALAAGFQTLEQGTWDVGRAVVGSAVAADSAATVFYNPAGMTKLESPELVMGTMGIVGESRFDTDSGTTFSGATGGTRSRMRPSPRGRSSSTR